MRRFVLVREIDVHNKSGTGVVVWGIQLPNKMCLYGWNSQLTTCSWAPDVDTVTRLHASDEIADHQGGTRLLWLDPPADEQILTVEHPLIHRAVAMEQSWGRPGGGSAG